MINLVLMLFNLMVVNKDIDAIYCDIKGNVKNQGVYEVKKGEVINDVIIKAGGLKKNSYVKNINLSKLVEDEMVINIITIDEYKKFSEPCPVCECEKQLCDVENTTTITTNEQKITTTHEITSIKSTTTISETTIQQETTKLLININTANLSELLSLPGIGEKTALKIIEYRENEQFKKIEDIKNIKGIGDSVFEKIKEYITV